MSSRVARRCTSRLTLCALATVGLASVAAAETFERCDTMLAHDVQSRAAAGCFHDAAVATGRWHEAARRLARAARAYPDSGWVRFYLAEVTAQSNRADALAHHRSAIDRFVVRSDLSGEVEARIKLSAALFYSGDARAAWDESHRATGVARAGGDRSLTASALIQEAWLSQRLSEQLASAMRALREAEALLIPNGPYDLRRRTLLALGAVS